MRSVADECNATFAGVDGLNILPPLPKIKEDMR